jgi:hypothetical protein
MVQWQTLCEYGNELCVVQKAVNYLIFWATTSFPILNVQCETAFDLGLLIVTSLLFLIFQYIKSYKQKFELFSFSRINVDTVTLIYKDW